MRCPAGGLFFATIALFNLPMLPQKPLVADSRSFFAMLRPIGLPNTSAAVDRPNARSYAAPMTLS